MILRLMKKSSYHKNINIFLIIPPFFVPFLTITGLLFLKVRYFWHFYYYNNYILIIF